VCEWRERVPEADTPAVVLPARAGRPAAGAEGPPAGGAQDGGAQAGATPDAPDAATAALAAGHAARDVAKAALQDAGFRQVTGPVRLPGGLELALGARDATGRQWLFEVAGGFTSTRPGLRRTELLWKVLGKAAVIREVAHSATLGVLTADLPEPGSPGAAALAALSGAGKPIAAVFRLSDRQDRDRLARAAGGRSP